MADRCEGTSAGRVRDYSPKDEPETSCQPTKAELAEQEKAREKQAEEARNRYFAGGGDEGGMSKRAASTPAPVPTSQDDKRLRQVNDANRTAQLDPPLEDDPWGNAIVAAAAGGVTAGVRAAAATAIDAGGAALAKEGTKAAAKKLAKEAVKSTFNTGGVTAGETETKPSEPGFGGESKTNGTSAPAKEPNQTPVPLRIPEAPRVIQG